MFSFGGDIITIARKKKNVLLEWETHKSIGRMFLKSHFINECLNIWAYRVILGPCNKKSILQKLSFNINFYEMRFGNVFKRAFVKFPMGFLHGFFFFSVRLLSVLRGHSAFSSPPHRPMTSDFEGFSIPDVIHYIFFPILILENEPVFPFSMFSAKHGHYPVSFW